MVTTHVSLFGGIEGFGLAAERAGIRTVASVEIEPACRGVTARHFPQAQLFDDVRTVTGDQLLSAGFVPGRGIITAGFPCQDLSVAGRRAGLSGARSGLFWEIMRLARELSPRWLVLENVPGVLSAVCRCPGAGACVANGRAIRCGFADRVRGELVWVANEPHTVNGGACPGGCVATHGGAMGAIVGALGECGYGWAYRVLDAQFFGLAQRRERVFFAGCAGDRARPVQVLLESGCGAGDSAPGQAAGADVARTLGSRFGGARTTDIDGHGAYLPVTAGLDLYNGRMSNGQAPTLTQPHHQREAVLTASTVQGGGRRGHRIDAEGAAGGQLIAAPLTSGVSATNGVNPPGRRQEDDVNLAAVGVEVRRLTPVEYERLQGFPDGWTEWLGGSGRKQSDSARYRQLGNAVAVPVAQWVLSRIVEVDRG